MYPLTTVLYNKSFLCFYFSFETLLVVGVGGGGHILFGIQFCSPDASASLASRSPTTGTILTPGSSPICDEIRVRVRVPNKTSAGQGSRNRDTAASPVAALDFTANKVTQASPSAWPSAGAGQKCHTTGNQSAWGKNGSLTNGKSPPGNLVWPHDMGEKMPDSPRSWARVLNSGLKPAHCPGMKNGLRTLGGVANAGLDEHPGLGDGRGRESPHRNAVSSMPSPDSFKFPTKTQDDPVISPKCVEPVCLRTPASSFSGETVPSSEFLIGSSRDGAAMDQSRTQGSSMCPSGVSLPETHGGSLSFTPVKRSVCMVVEFWKGANIIKIIETVLVTEELRGVRLRDLQRLDDVLLNLLGV